MTKYISCKLCGKEASDGNEYCYECYWRAKWPDHILNSPELERRRKRSHLTKLLSLDRDKPEAIFEASSSRNGTTYTTTLQNCTCHDFAITHGAMPCKHILRLAGELGLFHSEKFSPGESDYTLENKRSSLPQILLDENNDALTEKYVTIIYFILKGRENRINRLEKELEDLKKEPVSIQSQAEINKINSKLKILYSFQDFARVFRNYQSSSEHDDLLDFLDMTELIKIIRDKKRKTVDVMLPSSLSLEHAENILIEFKGIYPKVFSQTVGDDPFTIFDDVINTRRRSEKIIRSYNVNATPDWAFHVPEYFNDALDIKLVSRTKNFVEYAVWTQGANFSFDVGDMLYRNFDSYQKGTPALQIISASKAHGINSEKLNRGADSEIKMIEENDAFTMTEIYYPGQVVYRDFENGGTKTVTQLEFVKMLIGSETHA